MRAGKVLYGDDAAVTGRTTAACDAVDVCGVAKKVCLMAEVGKTYSALKTAAGANIYPAFTCGQPMNEPTCTPKRPTAVMGSTVYTGATSASDSDGDGIDDAADNCPKVFNPVRPLDMGMQGDADADGKGDACDPCPVDANTTSCGAVDPTTATTTARRTRPTTAPISRTRRRPTVTWTARATRVTCARPTRTPATAAARRPSTTIKGGMVPAGTAVRIIERARHRQGLERLLCADQVGDTGYMGADNSGLFVFTGPMAATLAAANVGSRVTIDGAVANFQGQIELDSVTAVTETATGQALPDPIAVTYAEVKTGGTRAARSRALSSCSARRR